MRAQLSLLEGQAGAPPDTRVVQGLRYEEAKRLRGAAHPEPVRKAEALKVEVLEVVIAGVVGVRVVGVGVSMASWEMWRRRSAYMHAQSARRERRVR